MGILQLPTLPTWPCKYLCLLWELSMRLVNCIAIPSLKHIGLFAHTAAVLQSQFVVPQYYTYWETSRGNSSKAVQVGQEVSDMDPSGNAMYYVICSAKLSLKDMHQVFKNKLLSIFSKMKQNVPSALSQKQYFNIAFMKEALLKEHFVEILRHGRGKLML